MSSSHSSSKDLLPPPASIATESETSAETTATTPDETLETPDETLPDETPAASATATATATSSKTMNSSKKSVSFNDDGHSELLIEQIDELDVDALWFTPEDYFDIKAQSRIDAKDWRRQGYGVLLKETFENPQDDAQDYLNAFCQLEGPLTRRGLERHLSRRHGEERSDLKDRARYCVLSHQRRLKRDGMQLAEMEEPLSKIYQDICRAAKIFARRLAKADEFVIQRGESNEWANAIVDEQESQHDGTMGGRKMERRLSNFSVKSGSSYDSFRLPPNSHMVPRTVQQGGAHNRHSVNYNQPPPSHVTANGNAASGSGRKPTTPKVPSASKPEEFYAAIA